MFHSRSEAHISTRSIFSPLALTTSPLFVSPSLFIKTRLELIHGRIAMSAVAGILFPAIATKAGAASIPEWYESNKIFQDGATAYPFGKLKTVFLVFWR